MAADGRARTRRALHGWLGLATLVTFLGTGLFMRYHEPSLPSLEPGPRLLFRSRHIYILLTALLNLLLWLRRPLGEGVWARRLAAGGSLLAALAPILAIIAFFHETTSVGAPSATSILAVEAALGAVLLHAAAELLGRRRRPGRGGEQPRRPREVGR